MKSTSFRVGLKKFNLRNHDPLSYSEWKHVTMEDWNNRSKKIHFKDKNDFGESYDRFIDMVLHKSFDNPDEIDKLSKRHKAILFLKLIDYHDKKAG